MKKVQLFCFVIAYLLTSNAFARECFSYIEPSTPTERFTVNADGTIYDKGTELLWTRCNYGQEWNGNVCTGQYEEANWEAALAGAENFELAGKTNWRLPNVKELSSIVERQCANPSLNVRVFEYVRDSFYWTSTPSPVNALYILDVKFQDGSSGALPKDGVRYALFVHDPE